MLDTLNFRSAIIWALMLENLYSGLANNKGADQHVHPPSLISAFIICFLEICHINMP